MHRRVAYRQRPKFEHCLYPGCHEPTGTVNGRYCHKHRLIVRAHGLPDQRKYCHVCGATIAHYSKSNLCEGCKDLRYAEPSGWAISAPGW